MSDIKIKSYSNSSCFHLLCRFITGFSSSFSSSEAESRKGTNLKALHILHPRDELVPSVDDEDEGKLKIHNINKILSLIYTERTREGIVS